jgi:hypothetical protein
MSARWAWGLQHGGVAVAAGKLDQPVLPGLEARRLAKVVTEGGIVRRCHGAQHVPCRVQLLHDARHAGEHLEGRLQGACRDGRTRSADFVEGEFHPQFGGLVLDDEQEFVMGGAKRPLRGQDMVERKVVTVGHAPVKRHLRAFTGGIVGLGHFSLQRKKGKRLQPVGCRLSPDPCRPPSTIDPSAVKRREAEAQDVGGAEIADHPRMAAPRSAPA